MSVPSLPFHRHHNEIRLDKMKCDLDMNHAKITPGPSSHQRGILGQKQHYPNHDGRQSYHYIDIHNPFSSRPEKTGPAPAEQKRSGSEKDGKPTAAANAKAKKPPPPSKN